MKINATIFYRYYYEFSNRGTISVFLAHSQETALEMQGSWVRIPPSNMPIFHRTRESTCTEYTLLTHIGVWVKPKLIKMDELNV